MTLWLKSQQLHGDSMRQLQSLYGDHFPIEVRHFLANYIESKPWKELNPDDPEDQTLVTTWIAELMQILETKILTMNSDDLFLMKLKLRESVDLLKKKYLTNPSAMMRFLQKALEAERQLVKMNEQDIESKRNKATPMLVDNVPPPPPLPSNVPILKDQSEVILKQLGKCHEAGKAAQERLRKIEQDQEAFAIQFHELAKLNAGVQALASQPENNQQPGLLRKLELQKNELEQLLSGKVSALLQMRISLAEHFQESVNEIGKVQSVVLDQELEKWKRHQQLAGNGGLYPSNLDRIQDWCEILAEVIWLTRHQIKEAQRLQARIPIKPEGGFHDKLPNLNSQITQLLSALVTRTFVIEEQPPQVMKTNTRFGASVRLLVGGKLNVHMSPPQVKVSIISEHQSRNLSKADNVNLNSGEIINNTGTMEYHQGSKHLAVTFRNMQLRKIKRSDRKGTESVMEEKFALLFQSQFTIGGEELVFYVWTPSLPVVVIVHGNQEPHAWATVSWDNAFAEPGRLPFTVPDKVLWPQVADLLNVRFNSACGRPLSENNLLFLASKVLRNPNITDVTNAFVSWGQFAKELLPDRTFTFWEWFYAILKMTKEHLRALWSDGLIVGFIGRKQTESMLLSQESGTFLLRYSDSELGGITVAWVFEDNVSDKHEVFMLLPSTARDFTIRSLADRLSDLKYLLYLYPDIPKDQAFGKYYSPVTTSQNSISDGYVRPLLVTHVPGWTELYTSNSSISFESPKLDPLESAYPIILNEGSSEADFHDLIGMDLSSSIEVDFNTINVSELIMKIP